MFASPAETIPDTKMAVHRSAVSKKRFFQDFFFAEPNTCTTRPQNLRNPSGSFNFFLIFRFRPREGSDGDHAGSPDRDESPVRSSGVPGVRSSRVPGSEFGVPEFRSGVRSSGVRSSGVRSSEFGVPSWK